MIYRCTAVVERGRSSSTHHKSRLIHVDNMPYFHMSLFAVTVSQVITNGAAAAADVIYVLSMNPNDDKCLACFIQSKTPSPASIHTLTAAWQK